MARNYSLFLLLALIGLSAAFFRPAVPHQVQSTTPGAEKTVRKATFIDTGLDNPNIANDNSIEASRKCGFCMGVSLSIVCSL